MRHKVGHKDASTGTDDVGHKNSPTQVKFREDEGRLASIRERKKILVKIVEESHIRKILFDHSC